MSDAQKRANAEEELSLSSLLKHAVIDGEGRTLGKLWDVVTRLRENDYPLLSGLVIGLGSAGYFVPMSDVGSMGPQSIRLKTAKVDLRPFQPRDGEVLLKANILGNRLIDVPHSALVKAYDVRLAPTAIGWLVTGLDVHKGGWLHLGRHEEHPARDWHSFLLLMGDDRRSGVRPSSSRLAMLRPAQIADIIESASSREEHILLAQVHEDPELEADVFEELDDDDQARLLRARGDQDVADLLSRMRADDAADAIMDLAQERRLGILELLSDGQKTKVRALLGYHQATAGGLMGSDFLALSENKTVGDALRAVQSATTHQPEALTTIYTLHDDGTLAGTLTLVRAVQSSPETLLREAADPNLVIASPGDDIITVTTRMADFNLLSLPVVDGQKNLLGIVTVDDALEAAIPRDWSRR